MEIIPNSNDHTNKTNEAAALLSKEQLKKLLDELDIPKEKKEKKPKKSIKPEADPTGDKEKTKNPSSLADILRENFVEEE